jgi:DNA-binding response OmpR family regulator
MESRFVIMIILVDDRTDVTTAYRASFGREGISTASFTPTDFDSWFHSTSGPDLAAIEAFILGDFDCRETLTRVIKTRTEAPAIALNDSTGLESTLKLFAAGADDVVRKPVHAREIIARIGAIRRRAASTAKATIMGDLRVFNDGGTVLTLPRRERRIIEQFATELTSAVKGLLERGEQFTLVTAPEARPYVRLIVDRLFPTLPVLSHIEISRGVRLDVMASLS